MITSYLYQKDFLPYYELFKKHCPPPLSMPRGSIICQKGLTSRWMYYLTEGMMKVYYDNYNGNERILAYLKKNSIFGLDCFDPDKTSIVTIECLTDVWIMPFSSTTIKVMMDENKNFGYDLVKYYCKVMRQLCFDAENQSIQDATTRLANFLFLHTDKDNDNFETIEMTQQDLASAVNCSRTTISRICSKFKDEGIIKIKGKGISIIDKVKLEKLCRF